MRWCAAANCGAKLFLHRKSYKPKKKTDCNNNITWMHILFPVSLSFRSTRTLCLHLYGILGYKSTLRMITSIKRDNQFRVFNEHFLLKIDLTIEEDSILANVSFSIVESQMRNKNNSIIISFILEKCKNICKQTNSRKVSHSDFNGRCNEWSRNKNKKNETRNIKIKWKK